MVDCHHCCCGCCYPWLSLCLLWVWMLKRFLKQWLRFLFLSDSIMDMFISFIQQYSFLNQLSLFGFSSLYCIFFSIIWRIIDGKTTILHHHCVCGICHESMYHFIFCKILIRYLLIWIEIVFRGERFIITRSKKAVIRNFCSIIAICLKLLVGGQ